MERQLTIVGDTLDIEEIKLKSSIAMAFLGDA